MKKSTSLSNFCITFIFRCSDSNPPSKPFITFAEFVDYVFELGVSRASKQKEIVFDKPKEIRVNASQIFHLETQDMLGLLEKHTYRFLIYKVQGYRQVVEL